MVSWIMIDRVMATTLNYFRPHLGVGLGGVPGYVPRSAYCEALKQSKTMKKVAWEYFPTYVDLTADLRPGDGGCFTCIAWHDLGAGGRFGERCWREQAWDTHLNIGVFSDPNIPLTTRMEVFAIFYL